MLIEPLPNSLDVRKAAARGVSVSGALKPFDLQRFRELLAAEAGSIQAELAFSRDEEHRYVVQVSIAADVTVTCQRCLEPMPVHLEADNTLAIVWTDDQSRALPKHLDALITEEESCNLWELVEDELILSMPAFSYHEAKDCNETLAGISAPPIEEEPAGDESNPFNVLAQLKPGNKH